VARRFGEVVHGRYFYSRCNNRRLSYFDPKVCTSFQELLFVWFYFCFSLTQCTFGSFYILFSPDLDFLPDDLYSIDLLVIPKWGLYANMTAQLISQLSSHFIIHYHRRIARHASGEDEEPSTVEALGVVHTGTTLMDEDDNEIGQVSPAGSIKEFEDEQVAAAIVEDSQDKLCNHTFRRPHRGEADKLVARRFVGPLLIGLSVILCVLILLGCILPSYSLNALGIVGVLVESGQGFVTANTEYSVITSMKLFFDQAALTGTAKDYIGLGSLTILLVMTVLVVPVVQAVVLLFQWFAPLTKKRRFRLSIVLEILQAWQYAEVYLLSLLVGSWQLGPLSGKSYWNSISASLRDVPFN